MNCSDIDALPSFHGASTISSSSGFVVEGVIRQSGVVHCLKVVDPISFEYGSYILYSRDLQFFSYGFASYFVSIWFLHLVFQGSPILFLWFRFLFCFYMVLTSCIPGISSSFLMVSLLILFLYGSYILYSRDLQFFLTVSLLIFFYMVLTSCIPGISSSFLMVSRLILFVYGSYILYSRDL